MLLRSFIVSYCTIFIIYTHFTSAHRHTHSHTHSLRLCTHNCLLIQSFPLFLFLFVFTPATHSSIHNCQSNLNCVPIYDSCHLLLLVVVSVFSASLSSLSFNRIVMISNLFYSSLFGLLYDLFNYFAFIICRFFPLHTATALQRCEYSANG